MAELANDMENFGSSCETCRKASVIVTLERTLRRLTEQLLNFDGRAKVLIAKLKSLIKSRSNLKDVLFKANRGGNDISSQRTKPNVGANVLVHFT